MGTRSKIDKLYARLQEQARVWHNSNKILESIENPELQMRFSHEIQIQRNELRLAVQELQIAMEDYFRAEGSDGAPIDLNLRSLYKKLGEAYNG